MRRSFPAAGAILHRADAFRGYLEPVGITNAHLQSFGLIHPLRSGRIRMYPQLGWGARP